LAYRCKKTIKKARNYQKLHKNHPFEANVMPYAGFRSKFSISTKLKFNTTVLIFTLRAYDQYFGVQMQKNREKSQKLPKFAQKPPI